MGVRGDCMFEDKTINAQKAGASALLVMNTENSVFIMSGKKVSEDINNGVPPNLQKRYSNNGHLETGSEVIYCSIVIHIICV